jgi:hypothetical protein
LREALIELLASPKKDLRAIKREMSGEQPELAVNSSMQVSYVISRNESKPQGKELSDSLEAES